MSYNWKIIFKSKTDKKLFEIFTGKSFLGTDAVELAEKELINRKFDFNDVSKYKKRWLLKSLADEKSSEKGLVFWGMTSISSVHFLLIFIIGLVLTLSLSIIYFTNHIHKSLELKNDSNLLGYALIFLIISIMGFVIYVVKLKYERRRNKRILEIKEELNNNR